ncbi:MAG: tetratricopeptide repeat protein [Gemmatimonadota bacterium]|nr:MAG: tetratricopeptide repeat protein [Gemmatimonadota bacterium]
MPMLKPRKRITKKQMKQDKLVTYSFKVLNYVQDHSRQFIFGITGLIVVLLIGFLMVSSKKKKEISAANMLGSSEIVYQSGDYQNSIPLFESVIQRYDGTRSSAHATYLLANAYFFTGNFDKAHQYFERYVNKYHKLPTLTASAIAGVAACYEEKEDYIEAGRWYERAASEFQDFYMAPEYLLSAGRCYESAGDTEKAKRVYQRIVDQYPESNSIQQAKVSLIEF